VTGRIFLSFDRIRALLRTTGYTSNPNITLLKSGPVSQQLFKYSFSTEAMRYGMLLLQILVCLLLVIYQLLKLPFMVARNKPFLLLTSLMAIALY